MAAIKWAYIGGGSTRAPGTVASYIHQGHNFNGSETVLVDHDLERLKVVKQLADRMTRAAGLDLKFTISTDYRDALRDCDCVLTSFRPGGFEARYIDESVPLKHGIIGQETQGPGGFFMAMRSLHILRQLTDQMEKVCPKARIFNYTNPVNIVAEAVSRHTSIPIVSLCEGPIIYNRRYMEWCGLDFAKLDFVAIGVNHASWTVRHQYEGRDVMPLVAAGYDRVRKSHGANSYEERLLRLAVTMGSLPSEYFQYYYFEKELFEELRAKKTTRSQDIMAAIPDYWQHYREQSVAEAPKLEQDRSRGGIHELELALDAMDAFYNNKREVMTVNVRNNGAIPNLPSDLVVELPGFVDRNGVAPTCHGPLPEHLVGLVYKLANYQVLAAEAGWGGDRRQAIQALASHPFMRSLPVTEALYDDMASQLKNLLPERLFS
jgi:6-phospho-beta-glucosidase